MPHDHRTYRLLTAAGLFAALACASGEARADHEKLLTALADALPGSISWIDDDLSSNYQLHDINQMADQIDKCRAAVKAALAGGVKRSEEVHLNGALRDMKIRTVRTHNTIDHYAPLGVIEKYCVGKLAKVQLRRTKMAIVEANQWLGRLDIKRYRSVGGWVGATRDQRICAAEVARALKMKNAPTINFGRPAITLGEAKAKLCDVLDREMVKLHDQLLQAADLEGFHAVLKDDRRKVFDDNLLFGAQVYGEGKFPLATPDDFENLDDWYLVSYEQNRRGFSYWQVTIFHFEGNKLVATDRSRHGDTYNKNTVEESDGDSDPPKEAYKPYTPAANSTAPTGLE